MIMTLQTNMANNRLSMMLPDKRMNPFTSPRSFNVAELTSWTLYLNYRQGKTQPQFVFQINFNVMHPVLLKLHTAKIMDVGGVAFHLFQYEFDFRLGDYLLFINPDDAGSLAKLAGAAAPARPNTKPKIIDW